MAATRKSKPDPLSTYRAKRSAERTPEPSGVLPAAGQGSAGGVFVVHQHAATRLHWDLRLEMDGVLRSWAVPRGPSRNPADKRLAVFVEDHPLEYGDFEGVIPEGNYGAGAVIVWDRGEWVPVEDAHAGLARGKLLFDLRGYKLKGRWTLVKIKKGQKEWLLIKERDGYVGTAGDDFPPGSVLSGLTVEELAAGAQPADALRRRLKKLKAPARAVRAKDVKPMLAETREAPFSREEWIFELKLDGYRIIAERSGGEAKLWSRNGHDLTATFPEVARAVAGLPFEGVILDGEVVVHDERGLPSFSLLQQRGRLTKPLEVRRAAVRLPAMFYAFDLPAIEGFDLRELPLVTRKEVLRSLLPAAGALRYLDHVAGQGEAFYAQVERMGLEGMVAKRAASPYRSRRSDDWLKIRADRVDDFVIVGMSAPKGSRGGFGSLHLAQYTGRQLVYSGRVGTGFDDRLLKEIAAALAGRVVKQPPCTGPLPAGDAERWVKPELVAEVRYKEFTADGLLRHPVFVRMRDDKDARECIRAGRMNALEEGGGAAGKRGRKGGGAAEKVETQPAPKPRPAFNLSNLDKVFWPEEKYTKGDLINYYREISPWLLPYLDDRPLVLTRYPDGITGKSFFQKDAPDYAQSFVRTVTMWSADSQRDLDYFVVSQVDELVYIANMAAIPLHIWSSRVASLETPDYCILDLDPKGAPFGDVVRVALTIRELCDEIEWPAFIKTSGSSGLHVLLPLARQCTYEQSRTLGGLLARVVAAELPAIATVVRQVHKREGKVYLDYVQNGHGRLLAAPCSVRPVPGALVSAPLSWKEVTAKLDLAAFTIRTMVPRMKKLKADPLLPVLELRPDLPAVLERLHRRVTGRKTPRG
jgi:bifunctional non-homologous end joining protein LigD